MGAAVVTLYRRLQMRHGLHWHTGKPFDWKLVRECIYALSFAGLFFYVLNIVIDMAYAAEELRYVRAKLEIREQQIVRCLNGQAVGYVTVKDRVVWTVCNPAETVEVALQ